MQNPLKKITVVFLLIGILPVAFLIYEFGQLSKNEEIVRETYRNQLEAILYSVNQHTDDLISNWAHRIVLAAPQKAETEDYSIKKLPFILNQVDVVRYVYFSDLKGTSVAYRFNETDEPEEKIRKAFDEIISGNMERMEKLIEYNKAGFRKMEPIDTRITGNGIPILFALDEGAGKYAIAAMVIDLHQFVLTSLAPQLQSISQGKFIIYAVQQKDDSVLYSTEPVYVKDDLAESSQVFKETIQKKEFWVMPGFYLAITVKGATIDDLVKSRTTTSLTILILLTLVLVAGLTFLYRNISREIHLSQAKSEFVSNVSHEIRTPLSLIGMFAETLETDRVNSEEKKKEYYSIISKETARLTRIVNRILNFSQLEANKKRFSFTSIRLNDLCKEILEIYFFPLKNKGYEFEFDPADNATPIRGDRESVAEAIINLMDNAVKYSIDKKRITIKTGNDNGFAYVEVKDEGIGIARKHHQDIFDQFYRAPTGDIHTVKGSGLGLTLVKKIMDAHRGEVKVESTPGRGSTFRLHFPIDKSKA